MTLTTMQAIFAPATWLATALLCLLLEAAGTPVGARKRGERTHLPWVIALAGCAIVARSVVSWGAAATPALSASGLAWDRPGLLSSALLAVLVVAAHTAAVPGLRATDEERGEMSAAYAILGAAFSLLAISADLLPMMAAFVLAACALTLVAAPDRDGPHGIEAATKGIIGAGLILVLLAIATLFAWAAVGNTSDGAIGRALVAAPQLAGIVVALLIVVIALTLGTVPLHQTFVDVAHGASASASSLLAGGALVAGGAAALRLVDGLAQSGADPAIATAFALLAGITLIGAPLASLDQTRIARVVAYVAVVPGGWVLAAAAAAMADPHTLGAAFRAGTAATVSGALGAASALLGVVLPRLDASSTWEDWAGFGRRRPVMAALLVYALANAAGVPGTPGFDARLDVAHACIDNRLDVLGLIVIASAAIGAAPIVRLALFLFAKDPPARQQRLPVAAGGQLEVIAFTVLVVASALLAIAPWALDAVLLSARR